MVRYIWVTLALLLLAGYSPTQAETKPNIVYILADDLGYGDPHCYNPQSKIPTPRIDRLAREGMLFTDAHSPSAVCTPTRYGILTGRYCWRTQLKRGVLQGYDPLLIESGRLTVPALLESQGYMTACIGKWHLGLGDKKPTDYTQPLRPGPLSVGFHRFFGIPSSLDFPPYVFVRDERVTEPPSATIAASKEKREGGQGFWREGAIAPSFQHADVLPKLTREAVAFIEEQGRTRGRPFFLYLPLSAPHTPWVNSREFDGKSGAGPYGDFVMQVDAVIGEIDAALNRSQLGANTLLIVTSDNGAHWLPQDIQKDDHRANGPWRGQKADIWEAGHRVPFIVRWPGKVSPNSRSEETICHVDLLATCAEIVGQKPPNNSGEDSVSILPALLGSKLAKPLHEGIVHHSGDGLFAIRQGKWKLIEGLGSGGFTPPRTEQPQPGGPNGQLYDLLDDPQEKDNLYLKKPDVVKELTALLDRYRTAGRSRP